MKISYDYDGVLSVAKYQEQAARQVEAGDDVYVISARHDKVNMIPTADKVGIFRSRVYAEGSNSAKVARIKAMNIDRHYDNNPDVIKLLPGVGVLIS